MICPSEATAKMWNWSLHAGPANGPMISEPFLEGPGHSLKGKPAGWIETSCGQKEIHAEVGDIRPLRVLE